MRAALTVLAIVLMLGLYISVHRNSAASRLPGAAEGISDTAGKVDFAIQVQPIFEKGCKPCHFSGGAMYQSLPFDHPETIRRLGERLLTRIKDENDRKVIREFLDQQ